jgi:hypothetical protein
VACFFEGYLAPKVAVFPERRGFAMKLKFHWARWGGELCPLVTVIGVKRDGAESLACLLEDTGGLGRGHLINRIEEGISIIMSALRGGGAREDWRSECWGARIGSHDVEAYSLYDETYKTAVRTEDFLRILLCWLEFISSEPNEEFFVMESIDVK